VFGGMILSTLLRLLVPVLFVLIERLREWRARRREIPN
jgi:hypothetical protein